MRSFDVAQADFLLSVHLPGILARTSSHLAQNIYNLGVGKDDFRTLQKAPIHRLGKKLAKIGNCIRELLRLI